MMVLNDISNFDDYLLEHLERLQLEKSQASVGKTLPHLDARGSHSSRSQFKPKPNIKPLPNLLEKTLVARFRRVEVTGDGQRVNSETQSPRLGLLPGCSHSRAAFTDVCWFNDNGWHGEDGLSMKRSTPIQRKRNRTSTSAPCGRGDAEMEAHQKKQSERKQENARIQNAVVTVREARKKFIKDRVLGVPRAFVHPRPHFKLVHDKSGQYRRAKQASSVEDLISNKSQDDEKSQAGEEKQKKPFKPEVPGAYVFPKGDNFIPDAPLAVEEAGVGWALSGKKKTGQQPSKQMNIDKQVQIKKDLRQRCRVFYPVTEALHKEGTSTTKIKSHTLKLGEIKVAKIWMQSSDPNTPPAHLAKAIKIDPPKKPKEGLQSISPYTIPFRQQTQTAC